MEEKQTEAEFHAALRAKLLKESQKSSIPMHMTKAPTGASKSLEDLLSDEATVDIPLSISAPSESNLSTKIDPNKNIEEIELSLIDDSPWQPRTGYEEVYIQQLAAMLQDRGQDEPVKLRPKDGGRFEIISGHRRCRAGRLNGWTVIDSFVSVMSDREAELATLISNEGHVGLTEYEKALSYKRAIERGFATSQFQVGRLFGCSQGRVSQCLSLLDLPVEFVELLDRYPGLFGYRFAVVISKLIKLYPTNIETVLIGVEQLIDKPDMETDDLVQFVERKLNKRPNEVLADPTLVSDVNGKSLFSVKLRGNKIVIDIKEAFDPVLVNKSTLAALRALALTTKSDED
jgi:ParB family chromosome partitioning protein